MFSETVGISWKEIEDVIITGGFGSSLNPESALTIGLFPPFKSEQFQLVGNAAGTGSKLCLISKSQRAKAQEIAKQIHYLELMTHSKFPTRFANAMFFQLLLMGMSIFGRNLVWTTFGNINFFGLSIVEKHGSVEKW
jgi:uncharacterized 2Fe-2S/4Fe-4S cluster protein (DUF4445 family)